MGQTVTLGGDRLGSGKKNKVHLHGFERSTHDMSKLWRSTMAPGTLVPFYKVLAKPGDTFDIRLNCEVLTHPTIGPLFGSYKVQLDVFLAPIRLYNSWLHNNKLNIGRAMSQVKLPKVELTLPVYDPVDIKDWNNSQVNPSALLAYLGMRGIGQQIDTSPTETSRKFNGVPMIAYWDIYKNYYANKQEEIGACIHANATNVNQTITILELNGTPLPTVGAGLVGIEDLQQVTITYVGASPSYDDIILVSPDQGDVVLGNAIDQSSWIDDGSGNITATWFFNGGVPGNLMTFSHYRYRQASDVNDQSPVLRTFDLENIDTIRENILTTAGNIEYVVTDETLPPYSWINEINNGIPTRMSSLELLAVKTYQNDINNNWLSTEWIDGPQGINEITKVDTSDGSFKIDALILARKVYDMLNRIAVSGGTYNDWQAVVYDHQPYTQCYTPMYMGGLSKELAFQEVVSNTETPNQPLGTLAGRGKLTGKHKGGDVTIKVDELSYIIGIVSITPRIDYSQGNDWDVNLQTIDDIHKPDMDQIGFQELITEQMAWWDTKWDGTDWIQRSAGKQPAWINYMTDINQVYGNFAIEPGGQGGGQMYMTLNRKYEKNGPTGFIRDLTTYIDPVKYNQIFAQTALDAQNFWVQISLDITARRKMSAKVMPNL